MANGRYIATLIFCFIFSNGQSERTFGKRYQNAGPDFPSLDIIRSSTPLDNQEAAVMRLIHRILPSRVGEFRVELYEPGCLGPKDRDTFVLHMDNGTRILSISASSGYTAAWGFGYFLTQYCGCMVSWAGRQLNVPRPLPELSAKVKVTSNDRFRYYQNVVTYSYSFVWWDWSRWEQEIDWMALNGINLPLAFNGQEAVWQRVYMNMGVTQKELDRFFGGPAFLAWARMGNIRAWGGPLSSTWHSKQVALQHRILDRMRALGMTPVLPAFAGHVPAGLARVFPNASISRLHSWGNFNATFSQTYLLDPRDPLFPKVGKAFIDKLREEFGTDHVYSCDTFNENIPSSSDPSYLSAVGSAVYEGMRVGDPSAIWVMQGWMFRNPFWQPPQAEALLTSVPQGRMIVLDLAAVTRPQYIHLQSFYGQPFIWCMLHNFGGNLPMYGKIRDINEGPFLARSFANSTMVGTGLAPEGINQNEMVYEFMNENAWRKSPRNLTHWIINYASRRYGLTNNAAAEVWLLLMRSVYNCTRVHQVHAVHVPITTRPSLNNPLTPNIWYEPLDVFNAWKLLLNVSQSYPLTPLIRYDLVDVTRQSLQLIIAQYYDNILAGYHQKNQTLLMAAGRQLLDLLGDLDMVLGSDDHFLLGTWLESAKALATNDAERKLYEYNARNQITLWGPDGNYINETLSQNITIVNGSVIEYATGLGNVSLADNTLVPHQNISDPVQPGSDEIEWPPFYSVGIPIISILVFILTLVIVYMRPSRDPAAKEVEKSVATRYRNRASFEIVPSNDRDSLDDLQVGPV